MELNHLLEAYKATTLTDELPEVLSNVITEHLFVQTPALTHSILLLIIK